MTEAGATMADGVSPNEHVDNELLNNKVDPSLVKFKVNLGEFSGDIPVQMLDIFLEIGDVVPRSGKMGNTIYLAGSFSSFEDAEVLRQKVASMGVANAFVVGEFNGRLVTADEAKTLLGN